MNKKTKEQFSYWSCECGQQDICRPTDNRISMGDAVFRKPGCNNCKRPMQLKGNDKQLAQAEAA